MQAQVSTAYGRSLVTVAKMRASTPKNNAGEASLTRKLPLNASRCVVAYLMSR